MKYKVVVDPNQKGCKGCVFTNRDICMKAQEDVKLSCVVQTNYGTHMGIIVRADDERYQDTIKSSS